MEFYDPLCIHGNAEKITKEKPTTHYNCSKTSIAINDPLGQTHSPASSDPYSHLKTDLLCEILKSGDGRTDGHHVQK